MSEDLLVHDEGGVLTLTIDRPTAKGAIDVATQRALVEALEAASISQHLRVVLIRSNGDDFCTGADVARANATDAKPRPGSLQRRTPTQAHRLVQLLLEIQLPVVSSVQGWAAGLGCQIALASDFVVAAESAQFWLPFSKRGFTADSGATWLLPRLVGLARARQMLLLGREIPAPTALEWGMIHEVVADDRLDAATDELVAELAGAATIALGLTKRSLWGALDGSITDAMQAESLALELSSRTADFREGIAAFAQRRPPAFEGR